MQGGHVGVISVPWEGTRCSVADRLSGCAATGLRLLSQMFSLMKMTLLFYNFLTSSPLYNTNYE